MMPSSDIQTSHVYTVASMEKTDTQTKYCNPTVQVPRVNNSVTISYIITVEPLCYGLLN